MFVREFRPIRRRSIQRLSRERWGSGLSIWAAEIDNRELVVDHIAVAEAPVPESVAPLLGLEPDAPVCVRRRRFVLDGKPVLSSTSYLPAELVTGSRITQQDTGPGGTYARLAELGAAPVHFQEQVRARMPTKDEAEHLALAAGVPVVLVCRTAFAADRRAVEVNSMVLDAGSYILEYDFDA